MTIETILAAHSTQREALAAKVLATLEHEWNILGSWDLTDVEPFIQRVIPVVTGAQRVTANLVDVYVSQVLTEMRGKRVNPTGVSEVQNLRGVPPQEVYRRPFVQMWTDLKNGVSFQDAKAAGQARLLEIGDDDLSLSYRVSSQKAMKAQKIAEYRRVVRPEMSKGGTCPLCHLASQNVYHNSGLLPIHTHCRCAVMPIIGRLDPAMRLNDEDLGSLETPKEVPVIRHHGELGPTLQVAGQHFTSEAQVA